MKNQLRGLIAAVAFCLMPTMTFAQCAGASCNAGAAGTGGESSGGNAQGFRVVVPSTMFPGGSISNAGNLDAGRLNVSDGTSSVGALSGTFRLSPSPSVRGHGTGAFGDWAGQCAEEDAFDNC